MDSLAGDAIVRSSAPGSILITRDYFSLGRDNFQGSQNDRGWTETPVTCHSETESPSIKTVAPSDTSSILYSPRGNLGRICTESLQTAPPGSTALEAQNTGANLAQWQWQNPRCSTVPGSISGGSKNNQRENSAPAQLDAPDRPPGCTTVPPVKRIREKESPGRGENST